jgi:hypothetical protein
MLMENFSRTFSATWLLEVLALYGQDSHRHTRTVVTAFLVSVSARRAPKILKKQTRANFTPMYKGESSKKEISNGDA